MPVPSLQEWQIEAGSLLPSVSSCSHACTELQVALAKFQCTYTVLVTSKSLFAVLLWSPLLDWLCGSMILHSSTSPSEVRSCIKFIALKTAKTTMTDVAEAGCSCKAQDYGHVAHQRYCVGCQIYGPPLALTCRAQWNAWIKGV